MVMITTSDDDVMDDDDQRDRMKMYDDDVQGDHHLVDGGQ